MRRRRCRSSASLVAVDGGRVVGVAAAWPCSLTIPGGELPCPGVTWVGVLPTHRRQGVLTALMRFQLDDVHERGEPLAALWASESLIYGRFGYGISAPVHQLDAVKSRFAFRDDPGPVGSLRLVTREEAAELFPPVYERIRAQRAGLLSRSKTWWWEQRLYVGPGPPGTGPRFFVVYERDGRPEGYAFYRIREKWEQGVPQGTVVVVEAFGETATATREIWRYLFGIDLTERVEARFSIARRGSGSASPTRGGCGSSSATGSGCASSMSRPRSAHGRGRRTTRSCSRCAIPSARGTKGATARARAASTPSPTSSSRPPILPPRISAASTCTRSRPPGRIEERTAGAVARADALFRTPLPPFCPEVF